MGKFLKTSYNFFVKLFIIFLPGSTFVTVFLTYKLHIPFANFIKEGIFLGILLCFCGLLWGKFRNTKKFPLNVGWIDIFLVAYMCVMVGITLFTTGIRGLVFGGRYDFVFLMIFWVFYHGAEFLTKPLSYYIKLFLWSGGIMLLLSVLLKFPLSEELLLHFGYSPNASAWDFGGAPPIFHGIDGGANVRRFQGLLDGPNTMGAFLILFSGLFTYFVRYKKDWYFFVGLVLIVLAGMLAYTYGRSAILGAGAMILVAIFGGFRVLFGKYKTQVFALGSIFVLFLSTIFLLYTGRGDSIINREGSTKGHYERMLIGVQRFLDCPFGQGLGSSGPAYRYVLDIKGLGFEEMVQKDVYYIPESWYIQQYVEGGIVGGTLFLLLLFIIFIQLFLISPIIAGSFAGIGVMNLFLHTYESSVISMNLFLFVGLFLAYGKNHKKS